MLSNLSLRLYGYHSPKIPTTSTKCTAFIRTQNLTTSHFDIPSYAVIINNFISISIKAFFVFLYHYIFTLQFILFDFRATETEDNCNHGMSVSNVLELSSFTSLSLIFFQFTYNMHACKPDILKLIAQTIIVKKENIKILLNSSIITNIKNYNELN